MAKQSTVETVENKFKFLELEVRSIEIKKDDGSINKFNAYKTFLKNGKKMDVKFTSAVEKTPKTDCMIKVNIEDMNIDNNRKYPCLWVKSIVEIMDLPKYNRKPNDYKEIDDMFKDEEDLPF